MLKTFEGKSTWREHRARSVTDNPPKSNIVKFLRERRSKTPSDVTPVCDMLNSSKVGIDKRCLIPESVILGHLERFNIFKFFIPETRSNFTIHLQEPSKYIQVDEEIFILKHRVNVMHKLYNNVLMVNQRYIF